jgi:hypothetical protein
MAMANAMTMNSSFAGDVSALRAKVAVSSGQKVRFHPFFGLYERLLFLTILIVYYTLSVAVQM